MRLHSQHDTAVLSHMNPWESKPCAWSHPLLFYFKVLLQSGRSKMILIWTACSFHLAGPQPGGRWRAPRLHKFTMKHEDVSVAHVSVRIRGFFVAGHGRRSSPGLFVFNKGEEEKGGERGALPRSPNRALGIWQCAGSRDRWRWEYVRVGGV